MGTMGSAVAQIEGADEYHNTLSSDLQENHELPQGEFVYGLTEQDAIDAFSLSGAGSGSVSTFEVDDADVSITQGVRVDVNEEPRNNWDYSYQGYVTDRSFSAGDVLPGSRTPEATPTALRPRRASSIGIRALTAKRPSAARSSRTGRRSSRTESGRGTTSRSRSVRTLTARSSNRISSSGPASRNRVSSSAASR